MFAVYECIDLGILETLPPASDAARFRLIDDNHVTFYPDPVHDDTVYAYHGFGIHVLNFNAIFQHLASSAKQDDDDRLERTIASPAQTLVQAILSTYSVERQ